MSWQLYGMWTIEIVTLEEKKQQQQQSIAFLDVANREINIVS